MHPMFVRDFYRLCEEFIINQDIRMSKNIRYKFEHILHEPWFSGSDQEDVILKIVAMILLLFLDKKEELKENLIEKSPIILIIERILMERKFCLGIRERESYNSRGIGPYFVNICRIFWASRFLGNILFCILSRLCHTLWGCQLNGCSRFVMLYKFKESFIIVYILTTHNGSTENGQ